MTRNVPASKKKKRAQRRMAEECTKRNTYRNTDQMCIYTYADICTD